MAIVHHDNHVIEWPTFAWPERPRRLFEFDGDQEWLRVEEFHDGDTLVVRAESPDIDPDKDVVVTTVDGVVRIHANREQKPRRREGVATARSFAMASSSATSRCRRGRRRKM